jgi:NAD+ synthase (glutamine-hydrolysing)
MKIALAQINPQVGDYPGNAACIISRAQEASSMGAELIVFSELSVCGYPPRDFLDYRHFSQECEKTISEIATACPDIGILLGGVCANPDPAGKDLFNAAFFLYEGRIAQVFHKTLLPTYDVFDEYRYFEPGQNSRLLEFKGHRFAVTICEDLWNIGNNNPLYRINPMDELMKQNPDMILNLSASPFSANHHENRVSVLKANCLVYGIPLLYVNQMGAQTELIFDGGSMVMNAAAELCFLAPFFEENLSIIDTEKLLSISTEIPSPVERIRKALVLGIRDYFRKLRFEKAVIGLSGGVDSALVLALATEALGAQNVLSVLLPSRYSSTHSIDDALELCRRLNTEHRIIAIEEVFSAFEKTLDPWFKNTAAGVAEENLQSRTRGVLLMALSNKFGYILLNTTNKSELAVGYGTLYGDMCGALAVIGDVYKTQVYELCKSYNRFTKLIPENILIKAPSAELRPGQKDTDSLPEYSRLDAILHSYIEGRKSIDEIIAGGADEQLVRKVLRMVNANEWKRFQAPPVLRVSEKAFGIGRRMPLEGKYMI